MITHCRIFILMLILGFCKPGLTQQYIQPEIETLFTDNTSDSVFIKLSFSHRGFDLKGNYFFQIEKNGEQYLYSKDSVVELLRGGGPTNSEFFHYFFDSSRVFHRKISGRNIYGPYRTDNHYSSDYLLSPNTDTMAVVHKFNGNYYFYINSDLKFEDDVNGEYWFNRLEWVTFGYNGDILHVEYKDGVYRLFKNDSLIQSYSDKPSKLSINNKGKFIYLIQKKYLESDQYRINSILKYDGKEFIVPGGCWDYDIDDNGNFIFAGFINGSGSNYFKMINGYYRDGFNNYDYATVENDTNFFYSCNINDEKYFVHGTTAYKDMFDTIYHPSIDSLGNFAMFGLKDYYLYKYVNGNIINEPLMGFNRRPSPIYISPEGSALYYFYFRDSVLVYKDSNIIFNSTADKFIYDDLHDSYLSPLRYKKERNNFRFLSLKYLQVNNTGYIIYNGKFSEPMQPFSDRNWGPDTPGEVVQAGVYENNFYVVQCQGSNKYLININNNTYGTLEDVDEVFYHNDGYFDGKHLTIFGRKGREFIKVNLSDE